MSGPAPHSRPQGRPESWPDDAALRALELRAGEAGAALEAKATRHGELHRARRQALEWLELAPRAAEIDKKGEFPWDLKKAMVSGKARRAAEVPTTRAVTGKPLRRKVTRLSRRLWECSLGSSSRPS